jgi:hypothetical protein
MAPMKSSDKPMGRQSDLFGELPPEATFLLYVARTQLSVEARAQVRRIATQEIDWTALIRRAAHHQVGPLLRRSLRHICLETVPAAAGNRLQALVHATTRKNLFLSHGLLRVLRLLTNEGLQVVPFKGPVVAATAYGDLTLRPFGDLDILVWKSQVMKARHILLADGFATCPGLDSMPTSFGQNTGFSEGGFFLNDFFGPDNFWSEVLKNPIGKAEGLMGRHGKNEGLPVELHWQLAPHYFAYPSPAAPFERLRPVPLLGEKVLTFSAEETLLHLVVHGTVHRWEKLRLVCDVAEMIRAHPDLDWAWTLEEAQRRRSERMLLQGLHLAHVLLGAPLPASIQERVFEDRATRWLADWALRRLFQEERRGLQRWWRAAAYDLRVRDRLSDGMGACLHHTHVLLKTLLQKA